MQRLLIVLMAIVLSSSGCVRRTLTVTSDPPGALLYLNGNEAGRTPYTHDFTWYGTYDVELRKENYQTLKTRGKVIARLWQWVPFDLVAEFLPLHDQQRLSYTLHPATAASEDPAALMRRAEQMQPTLQSPPPR